MQASANDAQRLAMLHYRSLRTACRIPTIDETTQADFSAAAPVPFIFAIAGVQRVVPSEGAKDDRGGVQMPGWTYR